MKQLLVLTLGVLMSITAFAQTAKLSGKVIDEKGEGLIQANVIIDASKGLATVTDFDGNYELVLEEGTYTVTYRYIGKEEVKLKISLTGSEKKVQNVTLTEKEKMMDQVVVTGSKYEKKMSEETVSMDVMKGQTLNNQNVTSLDNGVQKIPGVTIADGQANIRGGAGWSYGAGSRVLVLYDDLPILTADAGDAKWSAIPMENIDQVEVIKGAASALYGSGALNGVINARMAYPTDQPYTKVQLYGGFYEGPTRTPKMRSWSGESRPNFGVNFSDRRKLGQWDVTNGFAVNYDKGYLDSSSGGDFRINNKFRWRAKKIEGLNMGLNTLIYYSYGTTVFIWDSIGNRGYKPMPGTITHSNNWRIMVDPFISYYDKKDNRYSYKMRYLNSSNINSTGQGAIGQMIFNEFLYQKAIKLSKIGFNITAGAQGTYNKVRSPSGDTTSLTGKHDEGRFAAFLQLDMKIIERLNFTVGTRWEYFNIDNNTKNSLNDLKYPLFRVGLNYQAAEATFIRGSFAQGFRYPTIAELFIKTSVGPIGVYSNPKLQAEKGYSAEIGIKQGFKFDKAAKWTGFVDLAGFWNQYNNMMEFTFGQFGNPTTDPTLGLGFASQNIGNTRIRGFEGLIGLQGKVAKNVEITVAGGYTFIDPRALNFKKPLYMTNKDGDTLQTYFEPVPGYKLYLYNNKNSANGDSSLLTYGMTSSTNSNLLKYRNRHQFKFIFNLSTKYVEFNADYQYLSYQENIDFAFTSDVFRGVGGPAFQALDNYRKSKESLSFAARGDHILNMALAFKPTTKFKIALIVKNMLNWEYTARPGLFQAPRNYQLQLSYLF